MIGYLFSNRYRPNFGTRLWLKYWLKRAYHSRSLMAAWFLQRRFARGCRAFGDANALSPIKAQGDLSKLQIGSHCAIGRIELMLHDSITIGDNVTINDGCSLITGSHDINHPDWRNTSRPIVVESYAWIATRVILLPGVTIGEGAVVAAGAVVPRSVAPYTVVAGNPAKPVGKRDCRNLSYKPSHFYSLFESWLGPSNT